MDYKKQLLQTAENICQHLRLVRPFAKIKRPKSDSIYQTNSHGAGVSLSQIGKGKDKVWLELWLDEWVGGDTKHFSLCLTSENSAVVEAFALAGVTTMGVASPLKDTSIRWEKSGENARLESAFKPNDFRRPYVEIYEKIEQYYYTKYSSIPISRESEGIGKGAKDLEKNAVLLLDLAMPDPEARLSAL